MTDAKGEFSAPGGQQKSQLQITTFTEIPVLKAVCGEGKIITRGRFTHVEQEGA